MNTLSLLQGLRFVDSFFPSGGYAFSSGLEAAVQEGAVRNAEDLSQYVDEILRMGIGGSDAVAVALSHRAATDGKLQIACDADHELDAMKFCRESRLASRQMGRQVIRIAAEQATVGSLLHDFLARVEAERSPGHVSITLGLALGTFGWERQTSVAVYLYQSSVGLISAALKLLPIGQREAQRLLASLLPIIEEVSRQAQGRTVLTSFIPLQDIYAMRHSGLAMRLFRS
jgi:urease accessory protein